MFEGVISKDDMILVHWASMHQFDLFTNLFLCFLLEKGRNKTIITVILLYFFFKRRKEKKNENKDQQMQLLLDGYKESEEDPYFLTC